MPGQSWQRKNPPISRKGVNVGQHKGFTSQNGFYSKCKVSRSNNFAAKKGLTVKDPNGERPAHPGQWRSGELALICCFKIKQDSHLGTPGEFATGPQQRGELARSSAGCHS